MNFMTVLCFDKNSDNKYEVIVNLNYLVAVEQTPGGKAMLITSKNTIPLYTVDTYEDVKKLIQKSVDAARADYYGTSNALDRM